MKLGVKRGLFPWYTLLSTDPDKASYFYRNLLNWKILETPGPTAKSLIFSHSHGPFCDLVFLPPPHHRRSYWLGTIAVENLEPTLKLVEACGGALQQPPFDVPGIGRTALVCDPAGAPFMLLSPFDGEDLRPVHGSAPGQPCWNELTVENGDAVQNFYSTIAGWLFAPSRYGADAVDFSNGDSAFGSLRRVSPVSGLSPTQWMVFFAVGDLQNSLRAVELLGGRHHSGEIHLPGIGRYALIEDSAGALSYLFEAN